MQGMGVAVVAVEVATVQAKGLVLLGQLAEMSAVVAVAVAEAELIAAAPAGVAEPLKYVHR